MSQSENIAYVKTDSSVTLSYHGETFTALAGTPEYNSIVQCLREKNWEGLPAAASKALSIHAFSNGIFHVREGQLWLKDKSVPTRLAGKILAFREAGHDVQPLVNFTERLLRNPSQHSVDQLFGFLETNQHPITKDGFFIAYKSIREDWKDTHSGTMDNSPGQRLSMPREDVNPDPNQTCSHGLHVANWEYPTKHFIGARLIEVKVDPEHVVAVPNDYNNAKMRVCEYIVMSQIERPRTETLLVTHDDVMTLDSGMKDPDASYPGDADYTDDDCHYDEVDSSTDEEEDLY